MSVSVKDDRSTSFARKLSIGSARPLPLRGVMPGLDGPIYSSTLLLHSPLDLTESIWWGCRVPGLGVPLRRVKRGDRVIKRLQESGLGLCGVFLA